MSVVLFISTTQKVFQPETDTNQEIHKPQEKDKKNKLFLQNTCQYESFYVPLRKFLTQKHKIRKKNEQANEANKL